MDSWTFALNVYAQPGVSDACLRLQDEADVDVMLLLVAAFAVSQRHVRLDAADIAAMDDAVRPWREQVVGPLRSLRKRLKAGPSPAPSDSTDVLRLRIKADELMAERIANDLLTAWLDRRSADALALSGIEIRDVVRAVVSHALDRTDRPIGPFAAAIDVVATAVAELSTTRD